MSDSPALVVGWREYVGLPDLSLDAIKAKVDTGARTSALHAFRIETFDRDGVEWVRFWIHPVRKHREVVRVCEAPILDRRTVSDSGGHRELRVAIETTVRLGEHTWTMEMTLTDRDKMLFPMLLGRTAMEGRLLVDPNKSYVLGRKRGEAFKKLLVSTPTE